MASAVERSLQLEFPNASVHGDLDPPLRTMDHDASSEHGSLADSSYDIVSDYEANEDATTSSLASRVPTPATDSRADDDEYQDLVASRPSNALTPNDTPIASLFKLPTAGRTLVEHRDLWETLRLDRPFRIHFHGNPEYQEMIVEKIAQAIAVSNSTDHTEASQSRFNIIPLSSFGDDQTAPQVTLIPSSGVELVVETCQSCQTRQGVLRSSRMPEMRSMDKSPDEAEACCDSPRPDLAVYLHMEDKEDYRVSMQLASRSAQQEILTINIADSVIPERNYPLGGSNICMVQDGIRSPINVSNFLELEPLQLNRHIAHLAFCVASTRASSVDGGETAQGLPDAELAAPRLTLDQVLRNAWKDLNSQTFADFHILKLLLVAGLIMTAAFSASSAFQALYSSRLATLPPDLSAQTSALPPSSVIESRGPISSEVSRSSDWFATHVSSLSAVSQSAVLTMDSDGQKQGEDPPVELLHVKGWLYYVKMPNALAKTRRLPQLKVTASSDGSPVDVSLAKWNETVYSLELHPGPGSKPIDVFVGFAKSSRVYTYKLHPNSAWLAMKRLHSWVDQKSIESGIAACLATSKELSRMASKEVALFRDQANDLAVSSSEWLQEHTRGMRKSSETKAVDLWRNFELQTVAMTKAIQRSNDDISKTVSKRLSALSKSLDRQAELLTEAGANVGKNMDQARLVVRERVKALQRRFSDVGLPRVAPTAPLAKAQARAKTIFGDIKHRVLRARQAPDHSFGNHRFDTRKVKSCGKKGCKGCKHGRGY